MTDGAMPRILVTGGSGFIGTNLVEHFVRERAAVLNLDVRPPRNSAHAPYWRQVSILDTAALARAFKEFTPSHLIHMAARTDLSGKAIGDYDANTLGVSSMIEAAAGAPSLRRSIFVSSMLVCRPGYQPRGVNDYSPTTLYGESKVIGETLVRDADLCSTCWTLVRPTSIWGPWFGAPYAEFFNAVLKRRFVKFAGGACTKTFGFVANTVAQVVAILTSPEATVHRQTFYLGDRPALQIDAFADEIALASRTRKARTIPIGLARLAARVGDGVEALGMRAPLTTFRLRNMTTDNVVDLDPIYALAGAPPYQLKEAVRITLEWVAKHAPGDRHPARASSA